MTETLSLRTPRLLLLAAGKEDIQAERRDRSSLSERLKAAVPPTWPPEGIDDNVLAFFERGLAEPSETGWWFWYVVADCQSSEGPVLVGTCGFKGKPDRAGTIEIGYSMLPEYQGKGYATEAVEALVKWAWGHDAVVLIFAETAKDNEPSKRVLAKAGFAQIEPATSSGNVRFALPRPT